MPPLTQEQARALADQPGYITERTPEGKIKSIKSTPISYTTRRDYKTGKDVIQRGTYSREVYLFENGTLKTAKQQAIFTPHASTQGIRSEIYPQWTYSYTGGKLVSHKYMGLGTRKSGAEITFLKESFSYPSGRRVAADDPTARIKRRTPEILPEEKPKRTVIKQPGGGVRVLYPTTTPGATAAERRRTDLGERVATSLFMAKGYQVSKDKGFLVIEKEGRKQYLAGIVTKKQVSTGREFREGPPRVAADIPVSATYQKGFEDKLKQYDVTETKDFTPGAEITPRYRGVQQYEYETDVMKVRGEDLTIIKGLKPAGFYVPFTTKAERFFGIPERTAAVYGQQLEQRRITGEKAVLIGAGLSLYSYSKGVYKGFTAPIRTKFYTEEIPEMVKLVTKPGELGKIGPAIAQRPESLFEMAGYVKGFKITTKVFTRLALQPRIKPPKSKVPERYLKEAEVGRAEAMEVKKIGIIEYFKLKRKGTAISSYTPPKKAGYVIVGKTAKGTPIYRAKGGKPSMPWTKHKPLPDTARSQAFDKMTKQRTTTPTKTDVKIDTPSTQEPPITPYRSTPFKDMGATLSETHPFRKISESMGRGARQQYVLIEETTHIPKTTPTGQPLEVVFPSTARLRAVATGVTAARLSGFGLGVSQVQMQLPIQDVGQVSLLGGLQITKQKQKTKELFKLKQLGLTKQTQRQETYLIQSPMQRQQLGVVQQQAQISQQVTKQVQLELQLVVPKTFLVDLVTPESEKEKKGIFAKKIKTPFSTKYFASIEATAFNIKGPKPSKRAIATGLSLRPIIM